MELPVNNIKVEKLEKKEGEFIAESGTSYKYKNYKISFTIGDYPLIFTAKIDKTLNEYVDTALEFNENAEN